MKVKPILSIPLERNVPGETFWHFMAIAQRGWPLLQMEYMRTDQARNTAAQHLLDNEGFTHLVMLDLDHQHPVDIVDRFIQDIEQYPQIEVLGGLNFRRCPPHDALAFVRDEQGGLWSIPEWSSPKIFRCAAIGTGAICIARRVFEAIPYPWFAYEYPDTKHHPTEDIWFCERCREAGIKIFCDTRIISPHMRPEWIDGESSRRYQAAHLETVKET